MSIKEFREKVNLLIYDKKPAVLATLSVLNVAVSLFALSTLIYYYGFRLTPFSESLCFSILEGSFAFYVFRFLVKLFFDFHPPTFIRTNWFESSIILLLIIEGIAYNVFDTLIIEPIFRSIGFDDFGNFSMIFIKSIVFIFTSLKNKQRIQ